MTPLESTLSQRLAGVLLRLVTHVAILAALVALLVYSYPQLLGRPAVSIDGDLLRGSSSSRTASRATTLSSPASMDADLMADSDDFFIQPSAMTMLTDSVQMAATGSLFKVPQPQTIIPKRPRKDVITYTVQSGDNLSTMAERYDVDIDSLIWANGQLEEDPDYLVISQTVLIPPVSGVLYTVQRGDTLDAIAKKYKGDLRTMAELEYNSAVITASTLISGSKVMVPGGEKPYPPRIVYINGVAVTVNAPRGGGRFIWPAVGYISTFFGEGGHAGIDIAGPYGSPIYAADAGIVVFAGWNGGYGQSVIIDHGNGWQTLYGHFSSYYPQTGQNVRRGQAIGKMGSTGNSTGSHLHFEMHRNGALTNPLIYLPQ
jgi:murein DD-endopeptidase MepM/ murein hydrolase activator NlpD